jgi:hypothetical protein
MTDIELAKLLLVNETQCDDCVYYYSKSQFCNIALKPIFEFDKYFKCEVRVKK